MANPNAIFILESIEITVQCLKTETMRTIIQRFGVKAQKSDDSFIYLYNGGQVNLDLTFEEQANQIDRETNRMKILVIQNENNGFKCPHCAKKIKLDVDLNDIIKSYYNLKDTINDIKSMIESMINPSVNNQMNSQLKIINKTLNSINEDINKNNEKLEKIFNNGGDHVELKNKSIIKGIIEINSDDINKNINLFEAEINKDIEVYINNEKINIIKEKKKWKYNFNKAGNYMLEIIFNENITNCKGFFEECFIISLDLTNFNASNITDLSYMFNKCQKLKEIKGINKLITDKVTEMKSMFQQCNKLEYLDISNFDTSNVTNMSYMFNKCHKLKVINGISKFITKNVIAMNSMFQQCVELEYLDLNNFDTSNVTKMNHMFNKCNKLKVINGINKFTTHNVTDMNKMFQECSKLECLDLSNFNTSNVTDMSFMFAGCNKLKYLNISNFTINCKTENMLSFNKKECKFIAKDEKLNQLYKSA